MLLTLSRLKMFFSQFGCILRHHRQGLFIVYTCINLFFVISNHSCFFKTGDTETIVDLEREKNDLQSQLRETQENLNKNENSLIEMRKELTAGQTDLAESQLTIDTLKNQLDTLKDQPQAVSKLNEILHTIQNHFQLQTNEK